MWIISISIEHEILMDWYASQERPIHINHKVAQGGGSKYNHKVMKVKHIKIRNTRRGINNKED